MRRWMLVVLVVSALFPATLGDAASVPERPAAPTAAPRDPAAARAGLPLLFVENRGQTDGRVAFHAATPGGLAWFASDGVTWAFVVRLQGQGETVFFDV